MAHWLIASGRIDIHIAVSTLARFSHIATEEHFDDMVRVFEFLNKYPYRHLEVRNTEIDVSEFTKDINYDRIREDMRYYYPDAVDVWDPKWPGPKGPGVNVVIFTDASYLFVEFR